MKKKMCDDVVERINTHPVRLAGRRIVGLSDVIKKDSVWLEAIEIIFYRNFHFYYLEIVPFVWPAE